MIKALEDTVKWREVSSPEFSVSTGGSLFDSETNLATGNQLLLLRNSELGYRNLGRNVLAQQNLFRSLVTSPKSPYSWGYVKLLLAQTPVPDRLLNSYGTKRQTMFCCTSRLNA